MSDQRSTQESGFNLEKIYFPEQSLHLVPPDAQLPDKSEPQFGWDWRLSDPERFEVIIHITLAPTKARPEEVKVVVCGVFAILGEVTSVTRDQFVRLQGPAILFPYAREAISSLTSRSFFRPVHLPPVNIMRMMERMNPNLATGARQLASAAHSSNRTESLPGLAEA